MNRARDGNDGSGADFYQGWRTQPVLHDGNRGFTDATAQIDAPGEDTGWPASWLRTRDIDGDGDLDIVTDDAGCGLAYTNDGAGNFTRSGNIRSEGC